MATSDPRAICESDRLRHVQRYLDLIRRNARPDAGLTRAWDAFYGEFSSLIRRWLASRNLRGVDLEDCFQDVWLTVIGRMAEFEPSRGAFSFHAWLRAVVRSRAVDFDRRRIRERKLAEDGDLTSRGPDSTGMRIEESRVDCRRREELAARMRSVVSETHCQLLQFRFLDGLSVPEVARRMNLSPRQISYRQHRALTKLRREMIRTFDGSQRAAR